MWINFINRDNSANTNQAIALGNEPDKFIEFIYTDLNGDRHGPFIYNWFNKDANGKIIDPKIEAFIKLITRVSQI